MQSKGSISTNDGEPIDDFNVGYNQIHDEDYNEDGDYEYIKLTVAIDFLP